VHESLSSSRAKRMSSAVASSERLWSPAATERTRARTVDVDWSCEPVWRRRCWRLGKGCESGWREKGRKSRRREHRRRSSDVRAANEGGATEGRSGGGSRRG